MAWVFGQYGRLKENIQNFGEETSWTSSRQVGRQSRRWKGNINIVITKHQLLNVLGPTGPSTGSTQLYKTVA